MEEKEKIREKEEYNSPYKAESASKEDGIDDDDEIIAENFALFAVIVLIFIVILNAIFPSPISSALGLASFVAIIGAKVKAPKNKVVRICFTIYMVFLILITIFIIYMLYACVGTIRSCDG